MRSLYASTTVVADKATNPTQSAQVTAPTSVKLVHLAEVVVVYASSNIIFNPINQGCSGAIALGPGHSFESMPNPPSRVWVMRLAKRCASLAFTARKESGCAVEERPCNGDGSAARGAATIAGAARLVQLCRGTVPSSLRGRY